MTGLSVALFGLVRFGSSSACLFDAIQFSLVSVQFSTIQS